MVVKVTDLEADRLFHALADATRRDILTRVLSSEWSVSALAREYPISVTAVQKHVKVLEGAGLVRSSRAGRELRVSGDIDTVSTLAALLDEFELIWRARMQRIDDVLAAQDDGE